MSYKTLIFSSIILAYLACVAHGSIIRIGTKSTPPFTMISAIDGSWVGFDFDMIGQFITKIQFNGSTVTDYSLTILNSNTEGFNAVNAGTIDVWMAAVTITSARESLYDFTHRFFSTGLGILTHNVPSEGDSVGAFFAELFSARNSMILLSAVAGVIFFGCLVWVVETVVVRSKDKYFDKKPMKGLIQAIVWALNSLLSDSYKKMPRHPISRNVGSVLGFLTILVLASITAAMTSSAIIKPVSTAISGPEDLPVGGISGSTAYRYLQTRGNIRIKPYTSIAAAFTGFEAKEIDAVVHDAPILQYYVKQKEAANNFSAVIVGSTFEPQDYGMVLAETGSSALQEELNKKVLEFTESAKYETFYDKYFKVVSTKVATEEVVITPTFLGVLLGLMGASIIAALLASRFIRKEASKEEAQVRLREKRRKQIRHVTLADVATIDTKLLDLMGVVLRTMFRLNNSEMYYDDHPVKPEEVDSAIKMIEDAEDKILSRISTYQRHGDLVEADGMDGVGEAMLRTMMRSVDVSAPQSVVPGSTEFADHVHEEAIEEGTKVAIVLEDEDKMAV